MADTTFDAARHAEMRDLLGPEITLGAVRDLRDETARAFEASSDADLSHRAHAVSSQAEILGFLALGAACRELERSLKTNAATEQALAKARLRSGEAIAAMDAMLAG